MGSDIMHSHLELKNAQGEWHRLYDYVCPIRDDYDQACPEKHWPFWWRSYDIYAVIGGVRNYSQVKTIKHHCGLPEDSEYLHEVVSDPDGWSLHQKVLRKDSYPFDQAWAYRWFTIAAMLEFDYDTTLVDARDNNTTKTYREFLGANYFKVLDSLVELVNKEAGGNATRIRLIICFD